MNFTSEIRVSIYLLIVLRESCIPRHKLTPLGIITLRYRTPLSVFLNIYHIYVSILNFFR